MSLNSYRYRNGLPLATEVASIRPVSFVKTGWIARFQQDLNGVCQPERLTQSSVRQKSINRAEFYDAPKFLPMIDSLSTYSFAR